MKKLIVVLALALGVTSVCSADTINLDAAKAIQATYSGTTTGTALQVSPGRKSVQLVGYARGNGYQAMSGTALVECSNTDTTGSWVTCKDRAGNAITTTANAVFDIDSAFQYIRFKWTQTANRVYFFITQQGN